MNLSENCKVLMVKAGQAAGTDAITTDVVDMAGYREVVFLGSITTKNAANFVNLQEDSASTGATLADLAGTKCASDKTYFKLGLVWPKKRYCALKITRGVSTATGPVWAILFKARQAPIVSEAIDLDEETHLSPDIGTA